MAHDQRICGSSGADHFLTRDFTVRVGGHERNEVHNMTSHHWSKRSRKPDEAGQAAVFLVLALGLFLLGAVAFSVDMGNLWFHRQMAQGVADASCTAAAMDMLYYRNWRRRDHGGFTPGSKFFLLRFAHGGALRLCDQEYGLCPVDAHGGNGGLRRCIHVSHHGCRRCPPAPAGKGRQRYATIPLRSQTTSSRSTWTIESRPILPG